VISQSVIQAHAGAATSSSGSAPRHSMRRQSASRCSRRMPTR